MNWNEGQDTTILKRLGLFDTDSVRNEFTSKFIKINNVEVYKDFRDSSVHTQIEFTFDYLDSLNRTKIFKGANFSIKDGPENTIIFSQFVQPFATGFGIKPKDFVITYIYYIPGTILKHNASEKSKNKLTWKYNLEEIGSGKIISSTYRPFKLKETPLWIYILALSVIMIVVIFLLRKK
jgi:hypothetical protein